MLTRVSAHVAYRVAESEGKEGLDGLLMKETCYRAIGLGAFDFYDHVDFSAWFTNQLEKELRAELPPLPKYEPPL